MTLTAAAVLAIVAHLHVPKSQIDPYLVLAIAKHESQLISDVCKDEADGSSSRGLMQINHKDSRCTPEDNAKYAEDFDPATNIRHGVRLLIIDHAYHLVHCKHPHSWVRHYAGAGKDADRFAREVLALARDLKKHATHSKT